MAGQARSDHVTLVNPLNLCHPSLIQSQREPGRIGMHGFIQFSPKVGGCGGKSTLQRFAYPGIWEINKAGVGYAFQMWPSWPSLMGSIHITDTSKVSTMHNTPHFSPPYSGYAQIKPSVKKGNFGLGRIIFASPVVDGSIPLEEGSRVSSQRLLIEDALQPRALPHCSALLPRPCSALQWLHALLPHSAKLH